MKIKLHDSVLLTFHATNYIVYWVVIWFSGKLFDLLVLICMNWWSMLYFFFFRDVPSPWWHVISWKPHIECTLFAGHQLRWKLRRWINPLSVLCSNCYIQSRIYGPSACANKNSRSLATIYAAVFVNLISEFTESFLCNKVEKDADWFPLCLRSQSKTCGCSVMPSIRVQM